MLLNKIKATTNGTRHLIKLDKSSLIKDDKFFKLRQPLKNNSGRSTVTGHITSWHKGGGYRKLYRPINSLKGNKYAIVVGIVYNPNRSALLTSNFDFIKRGFYYNLAVMKNVVGSLVKEDSSIKDDNLLKPFKSLGSRVRLNKLPIGAIICNISLTFFSKPKYACSAGTKAQILRNEEHFCTIKLSTSVIIDLPSTAYGQLGTISNNKHYLQNYAKAGRMRNLGRRPTVRGIAMNPVDHPHGGKTNGGMPSVSPWGILTKCKHVLRRRTTKKNINQYV